jgi:Beta-propeller repeat
MSFPFIHAHEWVDGGKTMNWRGISIAALLPGLAAAVTLSAQTRQTSPDREQTSRPPAVLPARAAVRAGLAGLYGKLPLSFEANRGQTDRRVKFLSRGQGYSFFLAPNEAVLALEQFPPQNTPGPLAPPDARASRKPVVTAVRIRLVGGNPDARVAGLDELPGKSNYLIGNDPAKWRTDIPTYGRVRVEGVYPGISLAYYGSQRELEEDFLVAPGADPRAITLEIETGNSKFEARKIRVDASGDLVVETGAGEVRLRKPVIYQQAAGARREIAGGYRLEGKNRVEFKLGAYDPAEPLVIDPTLAYSTYLGGSGFDEGYGIAIDSTGNAYVTGFTNSPTFPGASSTLSGISDAFVAKLSADGTTVMYATYLGGTGADQGNAIAVDSGGNAYVTGKTTSNDFPGITSGAIQSTFTSSQDAFAAKLSTDGTTVLYATYLGGSFFDAGNAIAVDSSGSAYVTGMTGSSSFPGTGSSTIRDFLNGGEDAFVTKIYTNGTLAYSTYLGGSGSDGGNGIVVDSSGNAYVTGFTTSSDFPGVTSGSVQSTLRGPENAFVAEINAGGTALVYSTYLGGSGSFFLGDSGTAIAVDSTSNAYVTGFTNSSNFPVAGTSPFQSSLGGLGAQNAFVAKINAGGTALVYSTYLGGAGPDAGLGIAVDAAGNAYVTGSTLSSPFPGTGSSTIQSVFGGGSGDAFVTAMNPDGSALVYSTYLGGSSRDLGTAIAADSAGTAYVTGITGSSGATPFPTTTGAFQTSLDGSEDAFVTKIIQVVLFSSFSAKLGIFAGPPASFALNSTFTLGSGGTINPLTDPITLQVGTYSVTIPPGSFSQLQNGSKAGGYVFSGTINGVALGVQIVPLGGLTYQFKATGQPVNFTCSANPVTVAITIGNNAGSIPTMASCQ